MVHSIGVARIFDWGGPKPSKIRLSTPKLRVNFGPKSEIRTIFPPKFRWSPKKKKKKVFTEIKSDFSAEIGNSNDFSAQIQVISKKKKNEKKKVFTEIESGFSAETVSFTVTLLFNYCYVRNYWKKLQLNIVRLCCHNFLSLVEFWLGGGRAPWAPPPGYAYGSLIYYMAL